MPLFRKSLKALRKESDELQAAMTAKAMELAGNRETNNAPVVEIAVKYIQIEGQIFERTSTRELRRQQSEKREAAERLRTVIDSAQAGDLLTNIRTDIVRSELRQLEDDIRKIDFHFTVRRSIGLKEVALLFGTVAALVFAERTVIPWLWSL